MRPSELLYNLALSTLGCAVLPLLKSRMGNDPIFQKGRFGYYDFPPDRLAPSIWFHAASVGEVTGAIPTLHSLRERLPKARISLTVGTPQGFSFARTNLPEGFHVFAFPLDLPWVISRALNSIRPDLYVALESEFWPNLFRSLRVRGVPALLLNGRLSSRSAGSYRLLAPLFGPIFKQFECAAMLSESDRQNITGLGTPVERTLVLGSSKYDGLRSRANPQKAQHWRSLLNAPAGTPIVIGGSLRRSECTQLMEVFLKLRESAPEALGIFVPRHLEQVPNMAAWLEERHIPFQLLTRIERSEEKRREGIVLVDRIGILFELYSLGDLIFCGGTLEPIGGHNILEPAAWERPVFYGPHLQKVFYEHTILKNLGGSFMVKDADELLRVWGSWMERLPELERHGRGAAAALKRLGGVTEKQTEIILTSLTRRGCVPSGGQCKNLSSYSRNTKRAEEICRMSSDF